MAETQALGDRPSLQSRVAAEVRAWRGRLNLSQADVGRILGISQGQISARMRGQMEFSLSEVERLAEAFGIDPGELLGYASPVPARPTPSLRSALTGKVDVTTHDRRLRPGPRHAAGRRRPTLSLPTPGGLRALRLVGAGI